MAVRFDIVYSAKGSLGALNADIDRSIAKLKTLNAQLTRAAMGDRGALRDLTGAINDNIEKYGRWQTMQTQIASPTQAMTKAIMRQEITWRNLGAAMRMSGKIADEQLRLQRSRFIGFERDAMNMRRGLLAIPQALDKSVSRIGMQARVMQESMASVGANMVKAGKNMQWSGRQLTVGLTLPLTLAAVAAGRAAEEVDKQLTRIVKVYDFAGKETAESMQRLKDESIATAREMAREYGAAIQETLAMTAEFAQQGFQGPQLQGMTEAASRIGILGELESQQSVNLVSTLMAAFKYNVDQATASLNRFNQIENQTRLTLKDMADTIPQMGAMLANLNLAPEFGAALLAALKEVGWESGEAATALSFGLTRIFGRITPVARETWQDIFRIDPEDIIDAEDAEGTLYRLADLFKDLGATEVNQALGVLVEPRRVKQFMSLFNALESGERNAGAFARAMEAAGLSTEDAAQLADEELAILQNSVSNRLKRLRASIGAEWSKVGEMILPGLEWVLNFALRIIEGFNGMSQGTRKFIGILLGLVAGFGPVVMLLGLFRNLLGQLVLGINGMIGGILNLARVQRLRTREDQEQILITEQLTQAMNRQTQQQWLLTQAGQAYINSIKDPRNKAALAAFANAPAAGMPAGPAKAPLGQRVFGMLGGKMGTAGMGLAMAGGLGMASTEAGTLANELSKAATYGGSVMTIAAQLPAPLAIAVGIVAALGYGFRMLAKHSDTLSENMKAFRGGVEGMVTTMGYEFGELGTYLTSNEKKIQTTRGEINKFREENLEAVKAFKEMTPEARQSEVVALQYELKRRGMSVEEIVKTTAMMFRAADLQVPIRMKLYNPQEQATFMLKQMQEVVSREASLIDAMRGADFGTAGEELLNKQVETIMAAIQSGDIELLYSLQQMYTNAATQREAALRTALEADADFMDQVENHGVDMQYVIDQIMSGEVPMGLLTGTTLELANATAEAANGQEYLMQKIGMALGLTDDQTQGLSNLVAVFNAAKGTSAGAAVALEIMAEAQKAAFDNGGKLTAEMWQQILAAHGAELGIEEVADATDKADRATNRWRVGMQKARNAAEEYTNALQSSMQGVVGDVSDSVIEDFERATEAGEEDFDQQIEDSEEMWSERIKQATEYWDGQIKDANDYYTEAIKDEREAAEAAIKAIDDREKAEERLDRKREYIFEREKARMAYLAGQRTSNVQLNVALAEGDIDQAAIIREEISSREYDYTFDQSKAARGQRQANRRDRAEDRKETIRSESEAVITGLEEEQEKRLENLEAAKKARLEDLEDAKSVARQALEDQKDVWSDTRAAHKRHLDRILDNYKRTIPKTEEEFQTHLTELSKKVDNYGVDINTISDKYGRKVANGWKRGVEEARQGLREDARWEAFGATIANKISKGSLGLSLRDVMKYFATGELTNSAKERMEQRAKTMAEGWGWERTAAARTGKTATQHSGGRAGTGIPHAGGLKSDEIPAVLQRGEYVMDRKTVKHFGPDYFRGLQTVPKFHSGGIVSGLETAAAIPAMMMAGATKHILADMMVEKAMEAGDYETVTALAKLKVPGATSTGALGTLQAFMQAIRELESGGKQPGRWNYNVTNSAGYHGAYQFGSALWNEWDRRTLGKDVDLFASTPSQQDMVAAAAMRNYYEQYKDWGAVAAAWLGGPGGAAAYLRGEEGASDSNGTSVREYATWITQRMQQLVAEMPMPDPDSGGALGPVGWQTLARLMNQSGIPHIRTSDVRYGTGSSWHNAINGARAADFSISGHGNQGYGAPGLAEIYNFWMQYGSQLKELILAGTPNNMNIKNGRLVPGYSWGEPGEAGNHWNHVHVAYHKGGLVDAIPGLQRGGKILQDNTLANLHKGETVLTARLTDQLERSLDSSVKNEYNVKVLVEAGAQVNPSELARTIRTELQKLDQRTTPRRTIG